MSMDTEDFLRNQPRTGLSKEQEDFCKVFKENLPDSAYVVIVDWHGRVTFTAFRRGLFRSPMDKTLWSGILQERSVVLQPISEEAALGEKTIKVRDLGWNLIQKCTLSAFKHSKDDKISSSVVRLTLLPSENMVRRLIAEDSEPWFVWPVEDQSGRPPAPLDLLRR